MISNVNKGKSAGVSLTGWYAKAGLFVFFAFSLALAGLAERDRLRFDQTPGELRPSPTEWPAESKILRVPGAVTVLVFAHPLCTCTPATLSDLDPLLQAARGPRPATRVLFNRPRGESRQFDTLWNQAAHLPGATVGWDEDGRESRLFGARTSGLVLVYGEDGRLRFHGGINGSRGHVGWNEGAMKLERALSRPGTHDSFRVFGCSLPEVSS